MLKIVARPIVLVALAAAAHVAPIMTRAQDRMQPQALKKSNVAVQVADAGGRVSPGTTAGESWSSVPEIAAAMTGGPGEIVLSASEEASPRLAARGTEEAGQNDPQPAPEEGWQFQLTPYIWFSGIEGTVGARGLTTEVDAKFRDIIDELNFGAMGAFEARRGRLLLLTDMQYIKLSDNKSTPGALFSGAEIGIKQFILEPKVGYRALKGIAGHVDVFVGLRFWRLSNDINLSAGLLPARSASASKNWADPIFGTRFQLNLSPKFFVAGKGDFGGFGAGSDTTWELLGGVGYNLNKRYSLLTGYRYLSVNYKKDGFIYDTNMKGLVTGLNIRF